MGPLNCERCRNIRGIIPGDYAVTINAYTGSFIEGDAKYVVPKRFTDSSTSGLQLQLPADADQPLVIDFNLEG